MPFTLETYTMEQRIADTIPNGKYDIELEPIFSDEASGWKNQVLKGNETLYDYDVTAARIRLAEVEKERLAASTLVDKLSADLAAKSKDRKFAAILPGIRASIATASATSSSAAAEIPELKRELKKLVGLQEIAHLQIRSLRNVIAQYKENKNRDFLRRAIHCVAEIAVEKSAIYL
jgi:hypothetical protein